MSPCNNKIAKTGLLTTSGGVKVHFQMNHRPPNLRYFLKILTFSAILSLSGASDSDENGNTFIGYFVDSKYNQMFQWSSASENLQKMCFESDGIATVVTFDVAKKAVSAENFGDGENHFSMGPIEISKDSQGTVVYFTYYYHDGDFRLTILNENLGNAAQFKLTAPTGTEGFSKQSDDTTTNLYPSNDIFSAQASGSVFYYSQVNHIFGLLTFPNIPSSYTPTILHTFSTQTSGKQSSSNAYGLISGLETDDYIYVLMNTNDAADNIFLAVVVQASGDSLVAKVPQPNQDDSTNLQQGPFLFEMNNNVVAVSSTTDNEARWSLVFTKISLTTTGSATTPSFTSTFFDVAPMDGMKAVACQDGVLIYSGHSLLLFDSDFATQWSKQVTSEWYDLSIQSVKCWTDSIILTGYGKQGTQVFYATLTSEGNFVDTSSGDWFIVEDVVIPTAESTPTVEGEFSLPQLSSATMTANETSDLTSTTVAINWTFTTVTGNAPVQNAYINPVILTQDDDSDSQWNLSQYRLRDDLFTPQDNLTFSSLNSSFQVGGPYVRGTYNSESENFADFIPLSVTTSQYAGFLKQIHLPVYHQSESSPVQVSSAVCSFEVASAQGTDRCTQNKTLLDIGLDITGIPNYVIGTTQGNYSIGALNFEGTGDWETEFKLSVESDFNVKPDPTTQQRALLTKGENLAYIQLGTNTQVLRSLILPVSCDVSLITSSRIYCFDGFSVISINKFSWQISEHIVLDPGIPNTTWTPQDALEDSQGQIYMFATLENSVYVTTYNPDLSSPSSEEISGLPTTTNIIFKKTDDYIWFVAENTTTCDQDKTCGMIANYILGTSPTVTAFEFSMPAVDAVTLPKSKTNSNPVTAPDRPFHLAIYPTLPYSIYITHGQTISLFSHDHFIWSHTITTSPTLYCTIANLQHTHPSLSLATNCKAPNVSSTTIITTLDAAGNSSDNHFLYTHPTTTTQSTTYTPTPTLASLTLDATTANMALLLNPTFGLMTVSSAAIGHQVYLLGGDVEMAEGDLDVVYTVGRKCNSPQDNLFLLDLRTLGLEYKEFCRYEMVGGGVDWMVMEQLSRTRVQLRGCPVTDGSRGEWGYLVFCNVFERYEGRVVMVAEFESDRGDGLSGGAVAGIVVGSVVFAALVGWLVYRWWKRKSVGVLQDQEQMVGLLEKPVNGISPPREG